MSANDKSTQPCGCDEGANYTCQRHREMNLNAENLTLPTAPALPVSYAVKDSGKRMEFSSGMMRDIQEGKTDYSLIYDGPMFDRWAVHLTKGASKYEARNWMKARGEAEYERFRTSAARHFRQWIRGDQDEDHAAAVYFNINGAEYVRAFLDRKG